MLNSRELTPALAEANTSNAQQSTGPRTLEGKRRSRLNALIHGLQAASTERYFERLGETADEYDELSRSVERALDPRDEFEELIVQDLVMLRWRQARVRRGEAAALAHQRVKQQNDHTRELAREGLETLAPLEQTLLPELGIRSGRETRELFETMRWLLGVIRTEVEQQGFTASSQELLRNLYGKVSPAKEMRLLAIYEGGLHHQEANAAAAAQGTPEEQAKAEESNRGWRAEFLERLDRELANWAIRERCYLREHGELQELERDALLLAPKKLAQEVRRQEASLQRLWSAKIKELFAWRAEKRREAAEEAQGNGSAPAPPSDQRSALSGNGGGQPAAVSLQGKPRKRPHPSQQGASPSPPESGLEEKPSSGPPPPTTG